VAPPCQLTTPLFALAIVAVRSAEYLDIALTSFLLAKCYAFCGGCPRRS
jgi:hypothetical protein